jgi:hypothetical protein
MFDDSRWDDDARDRDDDEGARDRDDDRREPGHRRDLGDHHHQRLREDLYDARDHDERGRDRDDDDGRTWGADQALLRSQASCGAWPERVRVRLTSRRVPEQLQDGVGVVTPRREGAQHEMHQTWCSCRSVQTSPDRSALARRYLNVTDEELRKGLEVSWTRRRALRLITNGKNPVHDRHTVVTRNLEKCRARQDSNLRPLAPEANALSS